MSSEKQDLKNQLQEMWSQQVDFMKLLQKERNFPDFPVDITEKSGQKILKDVAHDCQDEIHEAIQLLKNSKQHRATNVSEFDRDHYIEELIDSQHYLFELAILSGIDQDEYFKKYMEKGLLNFERILEGY